jgi:acetate CoA/acetoacetate CoA-transferase alpha subunit
MSIDKVMPLDAAMARVKPGTRLMMGGFVGFGEPTRCIEWLVANAVGGLTLITNTPGLRGASPMASLFAADLVRELIGTHAATSTEASEAYLAGRVKVRQFFPMGTWAEKVRAGGVGLGGVLVPVGVGILDADGLFPELDAPKLTIALNGRTYFVEEALRAEVSIIKGWRADPLGNVEFRYTGTQNQRDIAMAGDFTIAEVNEIVPVGAIPPERVGCPGPFVNAVVQGESLAAQDERYRALWIRLGRLEQEDEEDLT